jgi:hypothetical protein
MRVVSRSLCKTPIFLPPTRRNLSSGLNQLADLRTIRRTDTHQENHDRMVGSASLMLVIVNID